MEGKEGRGGGGGDPPLPTERKVHFLGNSPLFRVLLSYTCITACITTCFSFWFCLLVYIIFGYDLLRIFLA